MSRIGKSSSSLSTGGSCSTGDERHAVARHRVLPQPRVEEQLARVLLVVARPLEAALGLEPRVAHAARGPGDSVADLVPGRLGGRLAPVVAHALRDLEDDRRGRRGPRRAASSARRTRWTRRSELVTVPSVSAQAAAAGRTTSAISAGRGQEDVLDDDEARGRAAGARCGGGRPRTASGSRRSRRAPSARRAPSRRTSPTGASRASAGRGTPHAASNFARSSSFSTCWKPGSRSGQRAHVAAALDVVLAAERVEAAAVSPDVPGEQREVDQREDVVDRVVVLGDPEGPADHRPVGRGVGVGGLADRRRPGRRSRAPRSRACTARPPAR